MITQKIKISNTKIIIFEVSILLLSIGILFQISKHNEKLYTATQNKILMLQTANRLRQSSDDLTHFARTYVVTGNKKYKQQYDDTLNIRNGNIARPKNYHSIYWDLNKKDRNINHANGEKISLDSLFNSLPYDKKEIEKLQHSKINSDDLVAIEIESFNAMVGKFKDKNQNYTIYKKPDQNLAINLMHSDKYYKAKEKIMQPIDDFILMLDKRTSAEILKIKSSNKPLFLLISILFIIFIIGNYFILKYLKNKDEQIIIEKSNLLKKEEELNKQLIEKNDIAQKLNRELEESEYELEELNKNLEQKVIEEVEKNTKIQAQLFKSEKMAAMGEMIGNIAHQWRQPLTVISTASTSMLVQKEYGLLNDELFEKSCDSINTNAQYLSKTIDDFRDYIKGDKVKSKFDINENIKSALNLLEGTIKKNNIKIILDLKEDIKIDGYQNELTQSLLNILNNSNDALEELDNETKLIFITSTKENNKCILTIKDNGKGINSDIINKVFEPYFTTKHQSQGTGLGLHMTYDIIVNSMGGNIEIENTKFKYNDNEYIGVILTLSIPL